MKRLATGPLTRREEWAIALFLGVTFAIVGFFVEYRSAFLSRRMGDLDCFLRAAWAVRNDADLYSVTSDNDWHYNYPPFYAILMTPLADPPRGQDTAGYVPYAWSVGVIFVLSVLALFWGAHVLASALEERCDDATFQSQPRFCRRWWFLRVWPIAVCFLPIGHSLMRGQVNLFVLALLCTALAGWLRGQNFRAGWWLALAICIKVIPAYLLVYPLWRRDWRGLAGCTAGCVFGLILVPGLVFGPSRTVTHYQTYARVFLGPIMNINIDGDNTRKEEITGVNSTDSVGFKNAIHNWMYPNMYQRPENMETSGKVAYLLLGFAMTFVTLWPRREGAIGIAHSFAGLVLLMTLFSPVCHSHYLLFCLPIVMSLLVIFWQQQPTIDVPRWLTACFVVFNVTMAIAYLPGLEILKDRCAALFATLPLWIVPVVQLWRRPAIAAPEENAISSRRAA